MEALSKKAREIISKILYITIATVGVDGKPWNSPVYSAFDENYNFYWISWKKNQHSKNIKKNNNIFLVIYDSTLPFESGAHIGVYVQAKAYELSDDKDTKYALKYLNARAGNHKLSQFKENMPRRIYKAVPEKIWLNDVGEISGNYIDKRIEITLQ